MNDGKFNSITFKRLFAFSFLLLSVSFSFGEINLVSSDFGLDFLNHNNNKKFLFSPAFMVNFDIPLEIRIQYKTIDTRSNMSAIFRMPWIVSPVIGLEREFVSRKTYSVLGFSESYPPSTRFFLFFQQSYSLPLNKGEKGRTNFYLGIGVRFSLSDSDRDGISNRNDKCPNTPRGAKVNIDGCPLDRDGDGVYDGLDRCPNTPALAFVDSLGCPFDSDSDGVYDGMDICPGTPYNIIVDTTGCPIDSDDDGVPDYADSCKNTPSGAYVNEFGCPKDSDYDGVYDGIDKCPFTPTGFEVNDEGCPHYLPLSFEILYDPVDEFGNLRHNLLKKLDMLALRIRAYPNKVIELGGYTDSEGSIPYNIGRAKIMVNKVKDYLLSKGVPAENLVLAYYGKKNFIADNTTPQGRAKNRRVEFKFLYDKIPPQTAKEQR